MGVDLARILAWMEKAVVALDGAGRSLKEIEAAGDLPAEILALRAALPQPASLGQYLADWEQQHGKLTEQELAQAAKELAPPVRRR